MRDVLDDDLAELYPVRGSDDVRLARLREQLFAEKPEPRTRRWIGIAAVAVVVVLITGLVSHLRPVRLTPDVGELTGAPATSLAEAAAKLEQAEPRGAFRHFRYEIWQTYSDRVDGVWHAAQLEFRIEVWLPSTDGRQVRVERFATGRQRPLPGIPESAPIDLSAQYSGPPLWGTNCPVTPCHETSLLYPVRQTPAETIASVSSPVLSPFTSDDRRAALYRELAGMPAVRYDEGSVSADGGKASFTLDPRTGDVTGYEERELTTGNRLPVGTVLLSVKVTSEWADQRPS